MADIYDPANATDISLLFADTSDDIFRFDETVLTEDGATVEGQYESPSLSRDPQGNLPTFQYQLLSFTFFYSADAATTVIVEASSDGGDTWQTSDISPTVTAITTDERKSATVTWSTNQVVGLDIRVRIRLTTNVLIRPESYVYRLYPVKPIWA